LKEELDKVKKENEYLKEVIDSEGIKRWRDDIEDGLFEDSKVSD
jgi:hypothetical protein